MNRCDCGNAGGRRSNSHDLFCRLNDEDDFLLGYLMWDPDTGEYVEAGVDPDTDLDQICVLTTCETPRPHTRLTCRTSPHPTGAAMSQPKKVAAVKSIETGGQPERVTEAYDIVEAALVEIHGDVTKEIWEKCCTYFTSERLATFERVSNSYPIDLIHCDEFEKFATEIHSKPTASAFYDCICTSTNHVYCESCGVMRANGDLTMPWIPIYARRLREVALFLLSDYYKCRCTSNKKYACAACQVHRLVDTDPWTYFNGKAVNSTLNHVPPVTAKSSSSTVVKSSTVTTWVPKCRHYGQTVSLPDGTKIWCSSQHKRKDEDARPDFGCYMAGGWEPDWLAYWLNWTDHGTPNMSMDTVLLIVDDLLAKARDGKIVEIGCIGGHGRTGSLLALMLLRSGIDDPEVARKYVWENYCDEAIEGKKQIWYIDAFSQWLKGEEITPMPPEPCSKWQHEQLFKKDDWCNTCPTMVVVGHMNVWLEDEAKKAQKAAEAAKKTPAPKQTTKSKKKDQPAPALPKAKSKYPNLEDPVDWDTPIPDGPDEANNNWCSQWRHKVLYMQGMVCDCGYWTSDMKWMPDRWPALEPIEQAQLPLDDDEIATLLDDLHREGFAAAASTVTDRPCTNPTVHVQPCVWVSCLTPADFEPGITISSADADEEKQKADISV